MAIAYRIDKTLGLTVVVWDGAVTGADAEDQVRTLQADPDWPPGPLHLLDTTSATSVPSVQDTKLVEMLLEIAHAQQIRFALVAGNMFEEATKFQEAASAVGLSRVIVFNDLTTACTWLGADAGTTRAALGELRRDLRAGTAAPPDRAV